MTKPSERDLEIAKDIVPLSNVYFRSADDWPISRERLIKVIAQKLAEQRKLILKLPGFQQLIGALLKIEESHDWCLEKPNERACGIGCDMGAAGPGPAGLHDPECLISELIIQFRKIKEDLK